MTSDTSQTDMLSIQLRSEAGSGVYQVDSVDIFQPSFRHRLTFSGDKDFAAILSQNLSDYVTTLIDRIDRDTMVLSEPDAVLELPGLVLGKLRVLVHTAANRTRQVIVRFAYFIGGVQAAFRVKTHFELPTISHREALAVAALHDICIPVFDVVSSAISGIFDDGSLPAHSPKVRLSRLSDVESDLLFYLQLLKRYVTASSLAGEPLEAPKVVNFPRPNGVAVASG